LLATLARQLRSPLNSLLGLLGELVQFHNQKLPPDLDRQTGGRYRGDLPELPELEALRIRLAPRLENKLITAATLSRKGPHSRCSRRQRSQNRPPRPGVS
jgi:hypothetical protein